MASVDPKGKVALVTGSTSGIGLAIAHSLAKRGANIIVSGLGDQALIDKILGEIRSYGVRADFVAGDVSTVGGINSLWAGVLHLYKDGVDVLINNAGVITLNIVETYPEDKWDLTVAINLSAAFHLTKRSIPDMRKKGWGRIINMSSVAGAVSLSEYTVYSATKFGLVGLTKGVALENAKYGITCNTVQPIFTHSAMGNQSLDRIGDSAGLSRSGAEDLVAGMIPTGKLNTPEQVAELVEFLCFSSASSQMTGAAYLMDGGYVAQ